MIRRKVASMARDWRKYDYNRQLFGERLQNYRLSLNWSLVRLSQVSGINRGTLKQVEEGKRSLPEKERYKLVENLTESLEHAGLEVSRREFFKLAGLTAVSTVLNVSNLQAQPLGVSPQRMSEEQTHEEYAETLVQQDAWQKAATFYLLAARQAAMHKDWTTWARCTLEAGQMALNLSQLEVAESRFREVLGQPEDEVGREAVVQAYIKLGWLRYAQDKFKQAAFYLERARTLLQNSEAMRTLQMGALHFLGRTYSDWGITENDYGLVRKGQILFQKAYEYSRRYNLPGSMGYNLMRQVPILLSQGETRTAESLLEQSQDLLGNRGTMIGHIYLHQGLLAFEEKPRRARELFERASEGYRGPIFYPKGLSKALIRISEMYAIDGKKADIQLELEYALAATALHPYGQNLEVLRWAAYRTYRHMGESVTVFNRYRQRLEERLWSMDGLFSDLKRLMESFGSENGMKHLETATKRATGAINAELPL
jgi:transcriptional regulator with XRE-family HTH domain